jgi:hypothetical protein
MARSGLLPFLLLGLLAWGGLAGCSMYRPPAIAVGEATLVEETGEALRLDIALDLTNPNNEPLELIRFEYSVSVDGVSVYRAKRAAEATLSASGGKRLTLPAVVRFDRVPWDGSTRPDEVRWSIRGSLLYVTPGALAEALLDTGVRKPRTGLTGSGRVRLVREGPAG